MSLLQDLGELVEIPTRTRMRVFAVIVVAAVVFVQWVASPV